ncbi:MAG: carboxypeptidase regulatory-like domain-containing protein, partial [Planctomycetota bacterium]|nr:carboxypeptidase regulatory-like domain-containing protein [Planctomycetota bacterium]
MWPCRKTSIPSNLLVVSDKGGIKDVVINVYTKTSAGTPKKSTSDQKGCMFTAPVTVVPAGSTITFKNSDPGLHNVRVSTFKNAPLNAAIPSGGTKDYTAGKAENIMVTCDLHPWMRAYVSVVRSDHYAVTDAEGNFKIENIPAGEYSFKAWHPVTRASEIGPDDLEIEEGEGRGQQNDRCRREDEEEV